MGRPIGRPILRQAAPFKKVDYFICSAEVGIACAPSSRMGRAHFGSHPGPGDEKLSQNPRQEQNRGTWGGLEATASRFRRSKRSQLPAPVLCQTRCLSGRKTSKTSCRFATADVLRPGHPKQNRRSTGSTILVRLRVLKHPLNRLATFNRPYGAPERNKINNPSFINVRQAKRTWV